MKKNFLFFNCFMSFVIVIILFGCPSSSDNKSGNDVSLNKVVIPLPKKVNINNSNVSKSVGLMEARNRTNYYEVILAHKVDNSGDNYDVYYSESADENADVIEIDSIPIGSYDILLLAGIKTENEKPLLLASSYVSNRDIIAGTNTVDMTVDSIDLDIESPNEVSIGTKFNVTVNIDTKNPFIKLNNELTLSYYKNGNDSPIELKENYEEIGIDLYKVTYVDIVAAISVATGKLKFYDYYYAFNNNDNSMWYIANDYPSLSNYYEKSISFVPNALPDVEVDIFWSDKVVTLNVTANTSYGTSIYFTGNFVEAGGNWTKAIKGTWSENNVWTLKVILSGDLSELEWKPIAAYPDTATSYDISNGSGVGATYWEWKPDPSIVGTENGGSWL